MDEQNQIKEPVFGTRTEPEPQEIQVGEEMTGVQEGVGENIESASQAVDNDTVVSQNDEAFGTKVQPDNGMPVPPMQSQYGEPIPPMQSQYGEPIPPMQSQYGEPIPPMQSQYGEPIPPMQSQYGNPVPPMQSQYGAPVPPLQSNYGAPMQSEYGNPVPPMQPQYGNPIPPTGNGMPGQVIPPAYGYNGKKEEAASGMAIASMVLGIVSIVLCLWFYFALPCAIVGLILGCVYRYKGGRSGMAIAGIVCSSVGIAFALIEICVYIIQFGYFLAY